MTHQRVTDLIKEFHAIKVKDTKFEHLTVKMLKEEYSMADRATKRVYVRDMLLAIEEQKKLGEGNGKKSA